MKKSMRKCLTSVTVAAVCVSCVTGCGGTKSASIDAGTLEQADTPAVEASAEAEEPEMDLGGMEIVIGDWWSSAEEAEPTTAKEEATREYREMIQEKYNFKIKQVGLGGWGDHQETFTVSTMASDPAAQIFIMDPSFVAQPMANGLFYDLSTLDNFDFSEEKWNKNVLKQMTKGDSVYGMTAGRTEPGQGVFWNKRLFKEAGLDPDLPYDLQASGEWTWEKFEELCKKLTVDKDNDGVNDTYAMANFSPEYFLSIALSNNAEFIGIDESGKYFNATTKPEFLEALQWGVSLIEKGYEMKQPEDSEWDWFISAFHDSKVAMQVAGEYKVGTWADMDDDFGFVLFPKGPKGTDYTTTATSNIAVIPACYDKETAEKIAFAYNLWTEPTPGYEEDDDWKSSYYTVFRDERAVDETLAKMYEPGVGRISYLPLVYGISSGDICYDVYALGSTPAEKIEQVSGTWESLINDANK